MKQRSSEVVVPLGLRDSESTKARILVAAREAFSSLGYDRATIRKIAEIARIHPSMVMRYFGSKETLFTASSKFDLSLPDFKNVPRENLGETIVALFLDRWDKPGIAGDLPAMLRLSVTHPEGREKAIAVFAEQVRPALEDVIHSNDPHLSSALIATQIVGIAFLRYVLQLPAVVKLTNDQLVRYAGETVQRYIDQIESADR